MVFIRNNEQVIKKKDISKEDLDTWQNYIKDPSDITNKDINQRENQHKTQRFKYDLHGLTLKEANEKVREIVFECIKKNYKEILLITGKGIHSNTDNDIYASKDLSKLRYSVPEYIKSSLDISKNVSSISVAEKKDGGEGAIMIKLKKLKNKL